MYSNISVFYSIYSADFLQVSKFYFKCLIIHKLFLLIVIPPLHLIHICIFLSCVLYTSSQYSSFYCIFFSFFILFSLTLSSSSSFTPHCVVFLCILYIFLILPIFSDFHLISVNFLSCILWMVFLMNESWSKIPPAARIHVGLTGVRLSMCRMPPHLLQVYVGLRDLLDAVFGEGGVPQQKTRQSLIVSQEMLQLEACGRKNKNRQNRAGQRNLTPPSPPPVNQRVLSFKCERICGQNNCVIFFFYRGGGWSSSPSTFLKWHLCFRFD